ncbi:hypothetical protein FKW77_000860 [Venturia effusa]|uniref:Uncharacterized protein n=1 Tax=Venturia effusa TaxID=50376 RepID=A0A517LMA4_9PEZI|nr:hypothetical protein FKW77_000860 [Venturia effusa]
MVTGHDKGREMTEKEVLVAREEEKKKELEQLRKTVGNSGPAVFGATTTATQAPGPVGYQGKYGAPMYTPSTIPGLGPLPTPTPQSSNENELNRLRRENASLKTNVKELKTKVMLRIEALAEDLRSLNSKTTEHQALIQQLTGERDELMAEVHALRAGDGHREIDLDMDFL